MSDLDMLRSLEDLLTRDAGELTRLDQYFRGQQPLSFLAPQIAQLLNNRIRQVVVNWPRLIVKSVARRLYVEGFRLGPDVPADDAVWQDWQANSLDKFSHLAHVKALSLKRSFATVWSNDDGSPRIAVESPRQVAVAYEPGTTTVSAAIKRWRADADHFANLYLPDRVVKFYRTGANDWRELDTLANPLGVVPVVPIVNEPDLDNLDGESELADVLPLADAINKLATDMMVSAEFHAMPRRWVTGIDMGGTDGDTNLLTEELIRQRWEQAYPSKFLLAEDPNTKFGQFDGAALDNFIAAIKLLASQVAALAGLPPHYLGINADNPASAEAIRSAEASLVERAEEKQRNWGESWEQVMRLAIQVRTGEVPDGTARMETIWRDPATPTIAQKADAVVKLTNAGVYDVEMAQEDYGLTPTQIARIRSRRVEAVAEQATAEMRARVQQALDLIATYGVEQRVAFAAVGLVEPPKGVGAGPQAPPPPQGDPAMTPRDMSMGQPTD